MAANKRRKLDALAESKSEISLVTLILSRIDISADVSAFAARKQIRVAHEKGPEAPFKTDQTPIISEEGQLFNSGSILGSSIAIHKFEGGIGQKLDQGSEDDRADSENISDNQEEDDRLTEVISRYCNFSFQLNPITLTRSRRKSREAGHLHPSNQSWTHFTTVNLSKDNAEQLKDGSLRVRIAPGEVRIIQRPK